MSWVKMDDQWPFHRKLRLVEPLDRLMWAMAIAYCSAQDTDGRLDGPMLEMVAFCAGVTKPYEAADRLVSAGLLDLDAGGWRVHNYLKFNFSSTERDEITSKRAEAGRKGGQKKAANASSKRLANASDLAKQTASKPLAVPSRPVPSRPKSSSGPKTSSVSQGSAEGNDDDDLFRKTLPLIADGLIELYEVAPKGRPGYKAAILRNPDEHLDVMRVLHADHPGDDPQQLAVRYLDTRRNVEQAHPQGRCGICGQPAHPNGAIDCPTMDPM
jgi:hypothetical protein